MFSLQGAERTKSFVGSVSAPTDKFSNIHRGALVFLRDGSCIASGCDDAGLRIWDVTSAETTQILIYEGEGRPNVLEHACINLPLPVGSYLSCLSVGDALDTTNGH